jgi:hypothetical protein
VPPNQIAAVLFKTHHGSRRSVSGPDRVSSVPDLHKDEAAREACRVSHEGLVVTQAGQALRALRIADAATVMGMRRRGRPPWWEG